MMDNLLAPLEYTDICPMDNLGNPTAQVPAIKASRYPDSQQGGSRVWRGRGSLKCVIFVIVSMSDLKIVDMGGICSN